MRYCADGGANRLYKHSKQHLADDEADDFIPDLVKGDLDSIKPHIKEYYQSRVSLPLRAVLAFARSRAAQLTTAHPAGRPDRARSVRVRD